MMDKTGVAVIGSGGIGGMLAAELVAAGRDVTLCVRTSFPELVIESVGKTRTVAVRQAIDPAEVTPVRWILLTTKAQDTVGAKPWVDALARPGTTLVVVQNGIGQAARGQAVAGTASVLPAVVYCSAERDRPGHIIHHGSTRLIVPAGSDADALAGLFRGSAFKIEAELDFPTAAWRKLLANLAGNPITALTLRRMSVFAEPAIRDLARALLREAVAVAQADGAALTDADADAIVDRFGAGRGSGGTSMLYDRLARRPLEHEALTGALVAAADRHGIPVPVNRTILALTTAASGHALDGRA